MRSWENLIAFAEGRATVDVINGGEAKAVYVDAFVAMPTRLVEVIRMDMGDGERAAEIQRVAKERQS